MYTGAFNKQQHTVSLNLKLAYKISKIMTCE